MKSKAAPAKKRTAKKSLLGKLDGAVVAAKRRAFKKDLPVVIYENGKFYLVYRSNKKVEATPADIEKILKK
ncbi:MAG TPA: hypothetical protein PLW44_15840 [Chitinophagales bacterium]|nr:hypothetical protein [Chitinophagales bacterium]